jgi:DNA-directed RNA polymerase specialized sigma24 family protein
MSYLDIAQKLGISIDNVYKRISQARAIHKTADEQVSFRRG